MSNSVLTWQLRDRTLVLDQRPLVMGIVNVTPDSFSDGGLHASTQLAIAHVLQAGAHLINDITALQGDPCMVEVVRAHQAGVVLMHMQGTPYSMQWAPT